MEYVFFLDNEVISYSLQEIIHTKVMSAGDNCCVASDVCELMRDIDPKKNKVFLIGVLSESAIIPSLFDIIKHVNKENRIILLKDEQPEHDLKYVKCDSIIDLRSPIAEIIHLVKDTIQSPSHFICEMKRPKLSSKELLVLKYLSTGRSNKEVSGLLRLSEKTISCHKQNILRKLNVRNIVEAINRI